MRCTESVDVNMQSADAADVTVAVASSVKSATELAAERDMDEVHHSAVPESQRIVAVSQSHDTQLNLSPQSKDNLKQFVSGPDAINEQELGAPIRGRSTCTTKENGLPKAETSKLVAGSKSNIGQAGTQNDDTTTVDVPAVCLFDHFERSEQPQAWCISGETMLPCCSQQDVVDLPKTYIHDHMPTNVLPSDHTHRSRFTATPAESCAVLQPEGDCVRARRASSPREDDNAKSEPQQVENGTWECRSTTLMDHDHDDDTIAARHVVGITTRRHARDRTVSSSASARARGSQRWARHVSDGHYRRFTDAARYDTSTFPFLCAQCGSVLESIVALMTHIQVRTLCCVFSAFAFR